jgi:hypothetical protein
MKLRLKPKTNDKEVTVTKPEKKVDTPEILPQNVPLPLEMKNANWCDDDETEFRPPSPGCLPPSSCPKSPEHEPEDEEEYFEPESPNYSPPTPTKYSDNYGGESPQYGDGSPRYGNGSPTYGAESPTYGAESPTYGAESPTYGKVDFDYNKSDDTAKQWIAKQDKPKHQQDEYDDEAKLLAKLLLQEYQDVCTSLVNRKAFQKFYKLWSTNVEFSANTQFGTQMLRDYPCNKVLFVMARLFKVVRVVKGATLMWNKFTMDSDGNFEVEFKRREQHQRYQRRSPDRHERHDRYQRRSPDRHERHDRHQRRSPDRYERHDRYQRRSPDRYERHDRYQRRSPDRYERHDRYQRRSPDRNERRSVGYQRKMSRDQRRNYY